MSDHPRNNQSAGNRVATYIARVIICLFGIGLLILFVGIKIWKTADFKMWMTFGALIGLCIGYGLGGDIWGARLFDLFTGRNTRRLVEEDGKDKAYVIPRTTLFILLGILICLLALLVRLLLYNHQTTS